MAAQKLQNPSLGQEQCTLIDLISWSLSCDSQKWCPLPYPQICWGDCHQEGAEKGDEHDRCVNSDRGAEEAADQSCCQSGGREHHGPVTSLNASQSTSERIDFLVGRVDLVIHDESGNRCKDQGQDLHDAENLTKVTGDLSVVPASASKDWGRRLSQ